MIKAPFFGQEEELLSEREIQYRYLIFKNYKLMYSVDEQNGFIKIAGVFDTRQNPPKTDRTKQNQLPTCGTSHVENLMTAGQHHSHGVGFSGGCGR